MTSLVVDQQLAEACHLNNEGAEHFEDGEWPRALVSLRQSLECIVAHVTARDNENGILHVNPDLQALHKVAQQIGYLPAGLSRDDSAPFLFQNPIIFTEIPTFSHETVLAVCGVIIFNMAIICHANGVEGDQTGFTKALQLYDCSIGFFCRAPQGETIFAGVLSLALNNKVQIYFEDCRFDELERDAATLSQLVSVAYEGADPSNSPEFDGILLNLMLLRKPYLAQAA